MHITYYQIKINILFIKKYNNMKIMITCLFKKSIIIKIKKIKIQIIFE